MILIVDNYDSFVQTLARYVREAGWPTKVVRNDAVSVDAVGRMEVSGVVLSPGPYGPDQAGICTALPAALPRIPMLGVCLGHLCLAEAYGGHTVRAQTPIHGRATPVHHDESALFSSIPSPFEAGRYHALIADIQHTPLMASAWSGDDELMAFRHPHHPHYGVQFHPESVLTPHGRQLMENFLARCR